ncbi:MAG: hypothetical protein DMG13_13620 [Acidobacteria bacterium]|nr:MAG: hypothetical protein DMG13_13620 [Acidobacteriota bacterium]
MTRAAVVPCEPILLRTQSYNVVPLDPRLNGSELERAITRGIPAYPDLHRPDFYDLELDNGWAYVHICDDLRTVYLVAYFDSPFFIPFSGRKDSRNEGKVDPNVQL